MRSSSLFLLFTLTWCGWLNPCFAEPQKRLIDLEQAATKALSSTNREEFYKLFYFASENKDAQETRDLMRDLIESNLKSGIEKVSVWTLKEEAFHDEVMGSLTKGILKRSPGVPLANLVISPKDPEETGLCFLFSKVANELKIVFHENTGRNSPFLEDSVSEWQKENGETFKGRFVRILDGKAYFRDDFMNGIAFPLETLSAKDRSRVEALDREGKQKLAVDSKQ